MQCKAQTAAIAGFYREDWQRCSAPISASTNFNWLCSLTYDGACADAAKVGPRSARVRRYAAPQARDKPLTRVRKALQWSVKLDWGLYAELIGGECKASLAAREAQSGRFP